MALADISLLPILITTILITKLLIANYHQPMREIDQNKTFSLLLFMHICAILGSISVAEDDTPIIGGWLGSLWSLRYVLAFFAAWLMECAWIIVGLRERERILFPALAFCLTEVCFWVWVLRIDQDYRVEVQVLGKRDVRDVLARLGWVFLAGSGCLAAACILDRVLWRKGRRGEVSAWRDRRHYGTIGVASEPEEGAGRLEGKELQLPKTEEAETQEVCAHV